jgi:RNA polymerase sigma-70 factor, ECF subfamily
VSGPEENELIQASRNGDRRAYGLLAKHHSRRVFGICYGILGNAAEAEDASQETLLKGFQAIGACRNGDSFAAWLGRIARNLCLDWVRRRAQHREWQREAPPRPDARSDSGVLDLRAGLERLPEELRLPLVLFYFEHQSSRAIAKQLELSHTTVCQRLREARQALHRLLSEGGNA